VDTQDDKICHGIKLLHLFDGNSALEVVSNVHASISKDLLWWFAGQENERAIEVARLISLDGIPLPIQLIVQLVVPHIRRVCLEFELPL
jgi:hypothetical protein